MLTGFISLHKKDFVGNSKLDKIATAERESIVGQKKKKKHPYLFQYKIIVEK